jgi:O-antigen ligase
MVLVVLTEPDPQAALIRLLKRCAYVLIPFSIMLIKYFPDVGREFNEWTGEARNSGVTTHKNLLGCDVMIVGLFFFWHWLNVRQMEKSPAKKEEMKLIGVFACMIGWLLLKAHSATALVTLLVGAGTMVLVGWRFVNKRFLGRYAVAAMLILLVAQMSFGVVGESVEAMGKDATISGRMDLWKEVVGLGSNPLFGTGFESFWTGSRLAKIWANHWWHPTEAHNGYLETYLNLGIIGLFILLGTIIAAFRKICAELLTDFEYGRFQLGFLAAIVAYNWTEAALKSLSLVFFIFYIVVLNYPMRERELPSPSREAVSAEEEGQMVDEWGGQGRVRPS